MTGPSPVDRGKTGSKLHALSDRRDLPLSVAVSAANTNDAFALKPLVKAIPAIKSQRGPRRCTPAKLHADKGRRLTIRYKNSPIETFSKSVPWARTPSFTGVAGGTHRHVLSAVSSVGIASA